MAPKIPKLLVTYPELRLMGIRFSRQHITRLMAKGAFPRPIKLGSNETSSYSHWRYADILDWGRAQASGLEPRALAAPERHAANA